MIGALSDPNRIGYTVHGQASLQAFAAAAAAA